MIQEKALLVRATSALDNPALIFEDQDDFLNQVLEIQTELPPLELLDFLKLIEKKIGRQERFRYGPREIDIDILFYGRLRLETESLKIPPPGVLRPYAVALLKELGMDAVALYESITGEVNG